MWTNFGGLRDTRKLVRVICINTIPSSLLVLELASLSYGGLKTYRDDDRLSDEPANRLLGRIVKRRRDAGEQWDIVSDLDRPKCEGEKLDQHSIYPWFPKTISELKEYIEVE